MLAPELIIDSIIEAYVQVDADLRIRFMNANAERLLRKNRAEAIGQTFTEVVPTQRVRTNGRNWSRPFSRSSGWSCRSSTRRSTSGMT